MFISINKIFIFLQSVLKKKSSMDLVILKLAIRIFKINIIYIRPVTKSSKIIWAAMTSRRDISFDLFLSQPGHIKSKEETLNVIDNLVWV